ncbi:MAG TPA: hypothetical protein DCM54_12385 [Gammaproteobacteria bacterium]|nr:hypothetical protein [Gammaproteobacteria bacterium]
MKTLRIFPAFLLSLILLQGCTSTRVITANSTPAIQAQDTLPSSLLMDIGITPFDPNIPEAEEDLEKGFIIPDVRRAESGYMAYHLKDTLELTGNWGAVRVTPTLTNTVDLQVMGQILLSDGEQLDARIWVIDSTGRTWLNKSYKDTASKFSYEAIKEDPFQDLYNDIANDILMARNRMSAAEINNIRQVSELKFAKSLSPDAFDRYLVEDNGRVQIAQLPAADDVMLTRVENIKEREYLFVDTMDDYYGRFYTDMRASYDEWRLSTYQEAILLRELQKQSRNRLIGGAALVAAGIYAGSESSTYAETLASAGVVSGGVAAIKSGLNRRKDAEIHAQSLRELGQSLGGEITPYVLEIEGKKIELSGTASSQYTQWRDLLRQIYTEETGLPVEQ